MPRSDESLIPGGFVGCERAAVLETQIRTPRSSLIHTTSRKISIHLAANLTANSALLSPPLSHPPAFPRYHRRHCRRCFERARRISGFAGLLDDGVIARLYSAPITPTFHVRAVERNDAKKEQVPRFVLIKPVHVRRPAAPCSRRDPIIRAFSAEMPPPSSRLLAPSTSGKQISVVGYGISDVEKIQTFE